MAMLTEEELNAIFAEVTFKIKNLDSKSKDQNIQKLVRKAYQEDSQPFNNISDDTTYYWFTLNDDSMSELFDIKEVPFTKTDIHGVPTWTGIKKTRSQVAVIEVMFIFYGNIAFDSSRRARMRLFEQDIYDYLKTYGIALRRELPQARYTYEQIQNRNWPRADFSATFNLSIETTEYIGDFVQINVDVNSIEAVKSIIIKED